jgi:hypothetical protein
VQAERRPGAAQQNNPAYEVAVERNPEYHYAPPLNPPRFGEGGGADNPDTLNYAETAPEKDADGYVLDETAAPSAVYATYISSTEAGVGNYEIVDGGTAEQAAQAQGGGEGGGAAAGARAAGGVAGGGAAGGGGGYEQPIARYAVGAPNTAVYADAEAEAGAGGAKKKKRTAAKKCTRPAPTGGTCKKDALPGGGVFCVLHACPECGAEKSGSAPGCLAHLTGRARKQSVYAGFDEADATTEA